jgi:intracellular sulfur oxidation DsrE/DsrF family protein
METFMIRRFAQFLSAVGLVLLAAGCSMTNPLASKDQVVFQVSSDDAKTWNLALNNAKNVQSAKGTAAEVEIVVYGPGIGMLKADAVVANRVSEAVKSGVKVVACQNTMRGQKLTPADMNADIGYVPAGVIELMAKQQAGWSYIRP